MSTILGYIIESLDEESIVPFQGSKKLHKVFAEALREAQTLYNSYMENYPENAPYEIQKPTKKRVDEEGSVAVFKGETFCVSITCIVA